MNPGITGIYKLSQRRIIGNERAIIEYPYVSVPSYLFIDRKPLLDSFTAKIQRNRWGKYMSSLRAVIKTVKGEIRLELYPDKAPVTVASFVNLAKHEFYDGLIFHRVIDDFMIQGGCPEGTGRGGPGYRFEDECREDLKHDRPGRLSMANAGPGTNGSQFFITHVVTPWLDGKHAIFGSVVGDDDMKVVNSIRQGDGIESIVIQGETDDLFSSVPDRISQWNSIIEK